MARLRRAVGGLRVRLRDCSIKTVFALYAATALVAAIVLSTASTTAIGAVAQSTLPDDPYAHSGTFVFDEDTNCLVPAEKLSWYEGPFLSEPYEGAESAEEASSETPVLLYVESGAGGGDAPISLESPPEDVRDGTIVDASWTASVSDVYEDALSLSEIASYDEAAAASRPGCEAAAALSEALPENADGERPVVSNVGYYVPYSGDTALYRTMAGIAIASVPVVFVACLITAGRLFYRNRVERPVAEMDAAARKIAEGDLDFEMATQRGDELGTLCSRFEDMRAELARSKGELWRAAENRRRVNAAFAHDVRTPLAVVLGRADLIRIVCDDARVLKAAEAISGQALRLLGLAESLGGLDAVDDEAMELSASDTEQVLERIGQSSSELALPRGLSQAVVAESLPTKLLLDERMVLRVADNLLSNAARHASSSVETRLSWEDGMLALAVSDDGEGFGPSASRALEPFWRGEGDGAGSAGGSGGHMGLGLYLCSVLCSKHGGSVSVSDSPEGGGLVIATFRAPAGDEAGADSGSRHA